MKKIFGYAFLFIAVTLSLGFLARLPKFLQDTVSFLKIFTGSMDTVSRSVTVFVLWVLQVILVFVLWWYGIKWVRLDKNKGL